MNRLIHISKQELNSSQKQIVLLCFFGALTILIPIFSGPQGHFVTDEGIYHFMVRSFAESGSLSIWNGYQEFPSVELIPRHMLVHDGRLVPSYPHLFAVLSFQFYRMAGFSGLFILNAIAFVATVGLCFLIARSLFRDKVLALNSCFILIFATFAWEYSQAAWPHAVSMFFVASAVYFAIIGWQASRQRTELSLAFLAGLMIGVGIGVRLATIFALPAILLPFLFAHPWRPRAGLALCAGLIPGLAALTVINHAKFGIFSPFSYGTSGTGGGEDIMRYAPVAIAGLACIVGAWIATRPSARRLLEGYRRAAILGVAMLGAIVLLTPQGWALVSKSANGAYQLLVDLRIRDLAIQEGVSRGPTGGMVYLDSLKKALLQSCPYLVALVLPLVSLLRGRDVRTLGILFLVPAGFMAVYASFAWHGGQSLNLRYFLPVLPFTSILTAFAWREISSGLTDNQRRISIVAGALSAGLYLALILLGPALAWEPWTLGQQEAIFLSLPLGIAAIALALVLGSMVKPGVRVRSAATAVLAVGLVWSGMVAFTYDFPRAYGLRKERAKIAVSLTRVMEDDSIVFSATPHPFYGLPDDLRLRVALPKRDDFRDFFPLVEFNLDRNRAVYVWNTDLMEQQVRDRGLFNAYAVVPLYEHRWGTLVQLARPADKQGPENPG